MDGRYGKDDKDGDDRGVRARRACGSGGRRRVAAALVILLALASIGCSLAPTQRLPSGTGAPAQQTSQAAATPAPQRVYVAVGASDAFGIGTNDPRTQAWPVVLARTLGASYRLIDLGIPGATVEIATRDELPIALDAQPAVVTIWLAVNDFDAGVPLGAYTGQLRALLLHLADGAHARIYVGNLPDLTLLPYFADRDLSALESQVLAWNVAIAETCAEAGATLVDLYTAWTELASHPEYISSDGFHPSASGAARLAALFAAEIAPQASAQGAQQRASAPNRSGSSMRPAPAARQPVEQPRQASHG